MSRILNPKIFLFRAAVSPIFLTIFFSFCGRGLAEKGDLDRRDPYGEIPAQQVATLGDPRIGLIARGHRRLARVGKSDYWLIDSSAEHPSYQISLVELDRDRGECLTKQVLAAGGHWSFAGSANLLFAGRATEKVNDKELAYGCFALKSNKLLWSFDPARKVMASTFSKDQKSVIVLASVVGKEDGRYHGGAAVVWLDAQSGKELGEVEVPGITVYNRAADLEDSKHGTYVTRTCKGSPRCYFLPKGKTELEALDKKLGLSDGEGVSWKIRVQPGEEKWVTFHQSQRLIMFERKDGKLVSLQKMEAGNSFYANDDCSNVRFSPEGDRLVVGSDYSTLIFDLKKPDLIEKRLTYGTTMSDFTSDGEFLVFWDQGGAWPTRTKDWVGIRGERGKKEAFHCCPLESVSFSPDGKFVATTDYQRIMIWQTESGKLLAELTSPRRKNEERCLTHKPAWNLKSGKIYGGDGYDVLEWNIADFSGKGSVVRLTGKIAFGGVKSRKQSPHLINVYVDEVGEKILEIHPRSVIYRRADQLSASRELILGKVDFYSQPWKFYIEPESDVLYGATGGELMKLDLAGQKEPERISFSTLDFSGERKGYFKKGKGEIAFHSFDKEKEVSGGIEISDPRYFQFATFPNGERAALISRSADEGYLVKILDFENREILAELPISVSVSSIGISPDGKFLALGCVNRAAFLWDLEKVLSK